METDSLSIARWQFRMAWSLADEVQLPRLTDAMCLWQPHPESWTVHRTPDERWLPEWAHEDPVEPPPPSIGWLSWHVIWWWSDALSVLRGWQPSPRGDVAWPGTAESAVAEIRRIAQEWREVIEQLSDAAARVPVAFPWPDPRPLIYTVFWVNMELMKNVAEIGEIANLFANQSAAA